MESQEIQFSGIIQEWRIMQTGSSAYIKGKIHGSASFGNGQLIATSRIIAFGEHFSFVKTKSNYYYKLGQICPDFEQWLKDNGHKLEDYVKEPIKH